MARIDYYAIQAAIKAVLDADTTLTGVTIDIARGPVYGPEFPWVGIYINSRAVAAKSISAGRQARYSVEYEIWCADMSYDRKIAAEARDDLMGKVEIALMRDRQLGDTVLNHEPGGGEFDETGEGKEFVAAGSITLEVEVMATV